MGYEELLYEGNPLFVFAETAVTASTRSVTSLLVDRRQCMYTGGTMT